MDPEPSSANEEREPKRQKRGVLTIDDLLAMPTPESVSSGASTTSTAVASTPTPSITLSCQVVSAQTSNQAEVKMASTPVDPHNLRGIRSKAGFNLLEGDHSRVLHGSQKTWVLPKKLLNSHSPYFARIPSRKGSITFRYVGDEALELFVQWLYLGELDFDGVDPSSKMLVNAWILGDKFECPAFMDHLMVQLIKSHHERGISPLSFQIIFGLTKSGSKLRKWAIDQFHAKLTYGYTGYDDHMDGDQPNDKALWKKYATNSKQFSQDFLGACLDASHGANRVKKPWENGQEYMEVLSYAEIGVCKEEGTSVKTEATLTKAERP